MSTSDDDVHLMHIGAHLDDAASVDSLRYMGPTSKTQLNAIGIMTVGDLKKLGVIDAYLAVQATGYPVNLNFVWAMFAGLMGIEFGKIPAEFKEAVKTELKVTRDNR